MAYRDDLDALRAREVALRTQAAATAQELVATRRAIAETEAKKRLFVLDNMRLSSPCPMRWTDMAPADGARDRVRHCGPCDKRVYNLSALTRAEAAALLLETEGKVCVNFLRRADGTVITADCPVGVKRRRRRLVMAGAAAALAGAAAAAVAEPGIAPTVDPTERIRTHQPDYEGMGGEVVFEPSTHVEPARHRPASPAQRIVPGR